MIKKTITEQGCPDDSLFYVCIDENTVPAQKHTFAVYGYQMESSSMTWNSR